MEIMKLLELQTEVVKTAVNTNDQEMFTKARGIINILNDELLTRLVNINKEPVDKPQENLEEVVAEES